MKNEQCVTENMTLLERIYEFLLCCYIVIVPVINSWSELQFWGYAIHITVVVSLLIVRFIMVIPAFSNSKSLIGVPILIFGVFTAEILLQLVSGEIPESGLLLLMYLFVAFLSTPKSISIKRIYTAYYVSTLVAVVYSFVGGLQQFGGIIRTAALVDSSISVIVLLIAFWGTEPFEKTRMYNLLKYLAIFASFVIVAFGMSRARILIVAIIIVIKAFLTLKNSLYRGQINTSVALIFFVSAIAIFWVLRLNVTKELILEITSRFSNGLKSIGRDEEIELGIQYFLQNPLLGRGWGTIKYRDYLGYITQYYNHCAYVAVFARGGIVMGLSFLLSFASIAKNIIKSSNFFCYIAFAVLLALSYGNAGIFNYTICSMLIPLILNMEYNISDKEQQAEI